MEPQGPGPGHRELEQLSAALARREAMLAQAESISRIGSWEWDLGADELHWSAQMYRIYGVDPGTFVPTPESVQALDHPEDREHVRSLVSAAVASGEPFRFEYRIVQPAGDVRILEATGRAENAGGPAHTLFGVVRDITKRKETDEALADAFSRERSARLKAEEVGSELESFVYTVSHDLNGPLISILGYVDLFESDFGATLPDEAKFYLERIKASGTFMQSLISDLLELSRVGRVQTEAEAIDVGALIRELADEVRSGAPGAAIVVDDRLPDIKMNAVRARQLFANLIQNSVKYAGRPDVAISIRAEASVDGFVTLSVTDDGPGIPPDKRERVFGVFERLDVSTEGTGMGLAVCKRIVETNGGRIWIADSDIGTDVRVSVPVDDGAGGQVR